MGIRSFFHKIKIGFTRIQEPALPYTDETKRYGNWGEDEFVCIVRSHLPDCKIKKNVIIQTAEGNAEIDCLICYKNKLFAVEVKRWKGSLFEQGDTFVQFKFDRWTEEVHKKYHKSPFKQLRRAIYLLRKQIPENAWLNAVVFFEGSDDIETDIHNVWFADMSELIAYIVNDGKTSRSNNASSFFDKCVEADYLQSYSGDKSLRCIICDDSLRFSTPERPLTRENIHSISVTHHWEYDELKIRTVDGACFDSKAENASIYVIYNGNKDRYALCKLDYIQLGKH